MELIKNDNQRLVMIFAQPIIIGMLLALAASDEAFVIYNDTKSIIFALSCAGIWIGIFNSIQEICKERTILKREYMTNLRLDAYMCSKLFVQFLISIIQSIIIILIFSTTVGNPEGVLKIGGIPEMIITITITIISSASLGLIISAISKTPDKAMTVAPFLLIIQLLFSGMLFELNGLTELFSYITISRWSVISLAISSNFNNLPSAGGIPREFEKIYKFTGENLFSALAVMLIFTAICTIISIIVLKNVARDSR